MDKRYTIKELDVNKSPQRYDEVKDLWRESSNTLGFFPDGAFMDYALKKQIIVALDSDKNVSGYVLYRVSKGKISIVHLCISEPHRKKGIPHLLIDFLCQITVGLRGIGLYCRRDYPANSLWPKLGFAPVGEKAGRGGGREVLTYWWRDYRNPTLFSQAVGDESSNKIRIVIDANIFFDLDARNNSPEGLESKALIADWFRGDTEIYVTEEIFTEINRNKDENERTSQRNRVYDFNQIESNIDEVRTLENTLCQILRHPRSGQDLSDIRHLAHAISMDMKYFITRDDYLLNQVDIIYEEFDLSIKRPAEIILDVDILNDELSYRPARLAGTLGSIRLVRSDEIRTIASLFLLDKLGEKGRQFTKRLARLLSQPNINRVSIVEDTDGETIALFSASQTAGDSQNVGLIRVKDGPLSLTLARFLLANFIKDAIKKHCHSVTVSDEVIQPAFIEALQEEGFYPSNKQWIKVIIEGSFQLAEIKEKLKSGAYSNLTACSDEFSGYLINTIDSKDEHSSKFSLNDIERLIWPGKILENDIPCYIVPIKPWWARELFDEELAFQDLFGAEFDLAIQNEGVYYSSGAKTKAPARILWYVSQNKKFPGSSSIRACSQLKAVTIDIPKNLFKKYRRLGVYKWEDVLKTARDDCNKKIIAMHFGQTELFNKPIEWNRIQQMLEGQAINKSLITATRISTDTFLKIYKMGAKNG